MTRFFVLCSFAVVLSSPSIAQSPTSAPTSSPSAVTSTASPEVVQFQKIENAWAEAVNQRDQYGLELVLSPLFVDVAANGDITTRNQQVASLISTDDKSLHLEQSVITVRTLGDIVVANGTYLLHHKSGSAQVDERGVFTHVFERVRGGWVCINSQRTLVRSDNSSKARKPSNAEMPFHIPLFSKSDKSQ